MLVDSSRQTGGHESPPESVRNVALRLDFGEAGLAGCYGVRGEVGLAGWYRVRGYTVQVTHSDNVDGRFEDGLRSV